MSPNLNLMDVSQNEYTKTRIKFRNDFCGWCGLTTLHTLVLSQSEKEKDNTSTSSRHNTWMILRWPVPTIILPSIPLLFHPRKWRLLSILLGLSGKKTTHFRHRPPLVVHVFRSAIGLGHLEVASFCKWLKQLEKDRKVKHHYSFLINWLFYAFAFLSFWKGCSTFSARSSTLLISWRFNHVYSSFHMPGCGCQGSWFCLGTGYLWILLVCKLLPDWIWPFEGCANLS